MAEGLSAAVANSVLDAICRSVAWVEPAAFWVQLHVGAPGAAGTANAAGETTRQQATFGSAASGGAIANTVAVQWTNVSTAEDYTHFTAWDASSAGNFMLSGTITANAVQIGDTFTVPVGDLDDGIAS